MANDSTLLRVAYGAAANMPAAADAIEGTMYVTTDNQNLGFKLGGDLFWIKTPYATSAAQVANAVYIVNGTASTATASFNGSSAQTFYAGVKPVVAKSTSATANTTTTNSDTYLNFLNRKGDSSWESTGGIKFTGSGATTVTATGGVITIASTNTTYATRPNPSAVKFVYGVNASSTNTSYDGNTATTIYGGSKNLFTTSTTGTAAAATANTTTYLNTVTRTGDAAWTIASSLQIKGSGSVSVSATTAGVLTITGTNTTYATRPNPAAIAYVYGTATSTAVSYDGNTATTIYGGAKPVVGAATSATANASSTANSATFLNIATRTGNDSWASAGGIQIKGSGATSVTAANGVITISSTNTTYATRPNPAAVVFRNSGTGTNVSYDGNTATTVTHETVGAAPATGIDIDNIDWTSYTAGWTLPAAIMPKEAMLDLVYVDNTSPTAATGVQVGDIIQTNNNKLYYVTAITTNGAPTSDGTTEIKVGTAAYASSAGQVGSAFNVYSGSTAVGSGFNGSAAKNVAFSNGLIVAGSSTATAAAAVTSNGVYVNHLANVVNGTSAGHAVAGSLKLVGASGVSITAAADGTITVTGTTYSTRPNPNAINFVYGVATTTAASYTGSSASTIYGGSKNIFTTSTTATAAAATANTTTYLNTVTRTGSDAWAIASSLQIKGSGATSVSATSAGVLTISSTNTTYATRPNPSAIVHIYGTGSSSVSYDGNTATTAYGGSKLIFASSATAVTSAATANTTTYLNLTTRTAASTYELANSLQIKGSGAVSVAADANGILTISGTNTTYATRPNPAALVLQGNGTQACSYDGNTATTVNIKPGTGISITGAASAITVAATAYTGTSPISVSGFAISHANSGATAGTYGSSASTISIGASATTTSFNIPRVIVNATGHVTGISNQAIVFGVSQGLTEGDVCGTVLGKTLYCGTTWSTF